MSEKWIIYINQAPVSNHCDVNMIIYIMQCAMFLNSVLSVIFLLKYKPLKARFHIIILV